MVKVIPGLEQSWVVESYYWSENVSTGLVTWSCISVRLVGRRCSLCVELTYLTLLDNYDYKYCRAGIQRSPASRKSRRGNARSGLSSFFPPQDDFVA